MPQRATMFGVTEDVFHTGAMPIPMLDRSSLLAGGDIKVGDDERVGVDRLSIGEFIQRQHTLVWVQGTAAPRTRISRDLFGVQPDPPDQQPRARWPIFG